MQTRTVALLALGSVLVLAALVRPDSGDSPAQAEPDEPRRAVVRDWPLLDATGRAPRGSTCGNRSRRVLLSFDDWDYAEPKRMVATARTAKRLDVGMLYFPLGEPNTAYRRAHGKSLADKVRAQGQYVGNHTYDHRSLSTLGAAAIRREIRGGVRSSLLRPPYGAYDAQVAAIASDLRYRICLWTLDTRDWRDLTPKQVRTRIVRNVRPGDVILLHMNHALHRRYDVRALVSAVRSTGLKLCRPYREHGEPATSPVRVPRKLRC
ncbi:polysaccharide deacetylase [Mumia flava]|uniref:Polysaccharide deacetylase n=1 Tax=Mumia flava TaxID=1348852 RepID=A0A0B2B7M9_9ACTN|nr:polysaccharide deacetylase family protein [Mumia flava]PJJ57818.1 polysaccharide deacetylase [Mumia flava]